MYVNLNKAQDAHMSPRYRFGHTSSQWRQERVAVCKTSSSSWIDGISHVLSDSSVTHVHFSSSPGSVSLTFLCSESSHLTSVTAPGFLSVILKTRGCKLFLSFQLNHVAAFCFCAGCCVTQTLTVKNRWCSLAQSLVPRFA